MVGAGSGDLVGGVAELVDGGELLEARLPVQARAAGAGRVQEAGDEPGDDRAGLLQTVGEVGGADEGLDRVGQDGVLVPPARERLALAELDELSQPQVAGDGGQGRLGDGGGAHLGELALGDLRVGAVEVLGDDDAQDGVAQELQTLVGGQAAVLVGVGTVGQGQIEQLGINARPPAVDEGLGVGARGRSAAALGHQACSSLLVGASGSPS